MIEEYPIDYLYSETHEWARVEGDVVTVGISKYALRELGRIAYVKLPSVGTEVIRDQPFGEIESGKGVADLNAPVDGEVVEVNEVLSDVPDLVYHDPYEEGWMVKIKMSDRKQLDGLLYADEYRRSLEKSGGE